MKKIVQDRHRDSAATPQGITSQEKIVKHVLYSYSNLSYFHIKRFGTYVEQAS